MTRKASRSLALGVSAAVAVAMAGPASAENVGVVITATDGTRQFAVQNVDGTALTKIDLGTGGERAFKTVVKDGDKKVVSKGYQVSAEMTNLYLKKADGTLDYSVKIPSADVSLGYATNPLGVSGLKLPVTPQLQVTGTLKTCADDATAKLLGLAGAVTDLTTITDPALLSLCTALSNMTLDTALLEAGEATANGVVQTVTSAIPLADLPFALTGAQESGGFSNASYAAGSVGEGDTAGKTADSGKVPTSKRIMTGTPAFTANLASLLKTAVDTAVASLSLVGDNTAARATLANVYTALNVDPAVATVMTELQKIPTSNQVSYLNMLTSTVTPIAQSQLSSITADYFALPTLKSTPTTPVAGTYDGTLVVTFVDGV